MKLMIDIDDLTYEEIMARDWKNAGFLFNEELKAIHDGTPIPDNATNGDMIKAMFPQLKIRILPDMVIVFGEDYAFQHHYPIDWWNAPYKRGDKE